MARRFLTLAVVGRVSGRPAASPTASLRIERDQLS